MRHQHGLNYAVLGIVARNGDGVHGYKLKRQCERLLGHFWQINFGEVYRILDQLVGEGLIEQTTAPGKALRKVYRISQKGQASLDDFIAQPTTDAPRTLRDELAVKLLFARPEQLAELLEVVQAQRSAYLKEMHALRASKRRVRAAKDPGFVALLLVDGAELRVRAELAWLDAVVERVSDQFGSPTA
jgi:DNA-binding PadR family transcriptional regulator